MAINTGGFHVQVMPQYTPADPNLIASHPENIANGILSAFKVADENAKLQAFKAQQDEINQLRQDRIEAAHALYKAKTAQGLADQRLIPATTQNKLYDIGTESLLQPFNRQIGVMTKGNEVSQLPTKLDMSNTQLAADASNLGEKIETQTNEAKTAALKSSDKLDNIETELALEQQKTDNELAAAKRAADAAPGDEQAKRDLVKATIRHTNAQADLEEGRKLYYEMRAANPRATPEENMVKAKAVKAIQDEMSNMLKMPVDNSGVAIAGKPNVSMTLATYRANRTLPDGTRNPDFAPGGKYFSPQAEVDIKHLAAQSKRIIDMYRQTPVSAAVAAPAAPAALGAPAGGTARVAIIPEIDVTSLPEDIQQAYAFVKANPDDPRSAAILEQIKAASYEQPATEDTTDTTSTSGTE